MSYYCMSQRQNPSSKFEVTVNEVLVHSKIGDGGLSPAGFPDTPAKLNPILEAITAAMEQGGK